jgi:hypothetical protein
MNRDRVKNILRYCRDIDSEIKYYKKQIQDYEDIYYNTSGCIVYDNAPKVERKITSPVESAALNIPDHVSAKIHRLNEKITELEVLKSEIMQELSKLRYIQKSILHDKYINGFQWVRISAQKHYSVTQCKNIRNQGLDKLAEYFAKNALIESFNYPK